MPTYDYLVYIVEFHKRGLSHAHIVVILDQDDRIRTNEQVDSTVSAEIPPDPESFPEGSEQKQQFQRLFETVIGQMRHGPCGVQNPNAPCMRNKDGNVSIKCNQNFPRNFVLSTR